MHGFKLDPEAKSRWVEALRSGNYVQGRGALKKIDCGVEKFCCLGVKHEIEGGQWRQSMAAPGYTRFATPVSRDDYLSASTIPTKVQIDLATMNDSGKTFAEIADYIEENL